MTQRDEGHKSIVWKISITTKYGTDVILVNQPKKPTQTQLDKLEKKWKKEFDIDDESEYPYIEVLGQIYAANTAMEVLGIASQNKIQLADLVANEARIIALEVLSSAPVAVEVLIFDRSGHLVGSANGW